MSQDQGSQPGRNADSMETCTLMRRRPGFRVQDSEMQRREILPEERGLPGRDTHMHAGALNQAPGLRIRASFLLPLCQPRGRAGSKETCMLGALHQALGVRPQVLIEIFLMLCV